MSWNMIEHSPSMKIKSLMDRGARSLFTGPPIASLKEGLVAGVMSAHRNVVDVPRDLRNFGTNNLDDSGLVRTSEK